jgi:hypothetical protein
MSASGMARVSAVGYSRLHAIVLEPLFDERKKKRKVL